MIKRIYLAGPMTGYDKFNFPAFDDFRNLYEDFGFEVFSPADHDRELLGHTKDWYPSEEHSIGPWKEWSTSALEWNDGFRTLPSLRDMLGADLNWICMNATHIAMLPGWERSAGANAEWALAKALNLNIKYYPVDTDMSQRIVEEQKSWMLS